MIVGENNDESDVCSASTELLSLQNRFAESVRKNDLDPIVPLVPSRMRPNVHPQNAFHSFHQECVRNFRSAKRSSKINSSRFVCAVPPTSTAQLHKSPPPSML